MLAAAVKNEAALENVAVKRTVFEADEVAAVIAERTTEPEPLVTTSPAREVSAAEGAPPVPNAMWETWADPDKAPRVLTR